MMDLFEDSAKPFLVRITKPSDVSVTSCFNGRGQRILAVDGEILYIPEFFERNECDYFANILKGPTTDGPGVINWKQDHIKMYGKSFPLPRLTAWYGDAGRSYTYSGITSRPNAWNEPLLKIKMAVEATASSVFNSVLLNWYRDGSDHLSWHADDEVELGRNPTIASVSFGAERDFVLRRKDNHKSQVVIPLQPGSLLIMRGQLQHFWQHCVPKRKRVGAGRINLTFRQIHH